MIGQVVPVESAPAGPRPPVRGAALRKLLREVQALGVQMRLAGAGVFFQGVETLPDDLRAALEATRGPLWSYLGGDEADEPALELADALLVDAVLAESAAGARAAIRQLARDKRQYGGVIAIDVETAPRPGHGAPLPWARLNADGAFSVVQPNVTDRTGLDPHQASIAVLQLYAGGTDCFLFRNEALHLLLHSHWLRRQHLVAHNASFEAVFLKAGANGYRPPPGRRNTFRLDCTMQMTGLMCGVGFRGGRSLANATKVFLGLDVPKGLQVSDWAAPVLSPGQRAYAASDAVLTWRLWPVLRRALGENDREQAYDLQRAAVPAVAEMELRGLRLDAAEHQRQTEAWASELAEARATYASLTGKPPPSKPNAVRAWLAEVLNADQLARWPRTSGGDQLAIGAAYLKRLAQIESCRPVLRMLAAEKLLANFGAKLAAQVNPVTGRLHTHYAIAGAKSGRFTSSNPNLQQLPSTSAPEFKRCVAPAPGNVLVGCDWSQIELRAAAWVSNDLALNQVYDDGRDLHAETASVLANIPVEQVTKAQRQSAKAVVFGSLYGMQAPGLVEYAFDAYGVEMDEGEAKQALRRFACAYPQLERWRWDNYDLCMQRGYVLIGAGRVHLAAWEPQGRLRFTQCCNLPIQGIAADCMLCALRLVHTRLLAAKVRGGLVSCVHDELLVEAHVDDADLTAGILQGAMMDAFVMTFPGAPARGVAEAKIGRSWAELKA